MRLVPRTLTSRLVVTLVALVATVGVLVGVSATLVMRGVLTDRLDEQVRDALGRATGPNFQAGPASPRQVNRLLPGTLIVIVAGDQAPIGGILKADVDSADDLSASAARAVVAESESRGVHSVEVRGKDYRVVRGTDPRGFTYIVGLPTTDRDSTLNSLVLTFAFLTAAGVGLAFFGGTVLVRRQLRPLREVADAARHVTTQDLSSGDTAIATRVAGELTDETTEVGQVGSALNTLLDHVDSALADRHRSEQQVRQFVADASHELRTPLSTIHGYAELSRRTPDDPEVLSTALNKVETEAGRMSALVEDLLLLARLDSGRPLASDEVDLTRLLLEAVADARVLAPEHRWHLDLPDEPVTATGDADRLHQVVTNLLNNARNHTPAGTTVTVAVTRDADGTRITVHDDGPGLPEDIAGNAFERFTRGDSSRTRASGGAGLGLSLVSAITAAHRGTARVESRPGSTTFTVELPHPAQPGAEAQ